MLATRSACQYRVSLLATYVVDHHVRDKVDWCATHAFDTSSECVSVRHDERQTTCVAMGGGGDEDTFCRLCQIFLQLHFVNVSIRITGVTLVWCRSAGTIATVGMLY